jgi:L-lactate dehydrogenase complex protein LldG
MDKLDQFTKAAESAAATVECIAPTGAAIQQAVVRQLNGATRFAIGDSRDLPAEWLSACRSLPGAMPTFSKTDLAGIEVGVTEAFGGVATTGSVCVSVGDGNSGAVSLVVRRHIALLSARDIVDRPSDLLRAECLGGKGLERDFVFITGPSATADMGPLVRGVHGPHQLHILLIASS